MVEGKKSQLGVLTMIEDLITSDWSFCLFSRYFLTVFERLKAMPSRSVSCEGPEATALF